MKQKFRITGIAEDHIDYGERGKDGYPKYRPGFRLTIQAVNYYPPLFGSFQTPPLLTTERFNVGDEIEISVERA